MTNENILMPNMKLQGKIIQETDHRNYDYKYLGLPITIQDINVKQYFKKIRQNFYSTLNEVIAYAENNQLEIYYKLTLYKTVIRALIDYCVTVICYTNEEIKLEQDQIQH